LWSSDNFFITFANLTGEQAIFIPTCLPLPSWSIGILSFLVVDDHVEQQLRGVQVLLFYLSNFKVICRDVYNYFASVMLPDGIKCVY
jgi:hypothetical protein